MGFGVLLLNFFIRNDVKQIGDDVKHLCLEITEIKSTVALVVDNLVLKFRQTRHGLITEIATIKTHVSDPSSRMLADNPMSVTAIARSGFGGFPV